MKNTISNGQGGKKARQHLEDKNNDSNATLTFPDHWNNEDVRGALYATFGKTCAYCSCNLPRNDRGDVEHYRPKAKIEEDPEHEGYWWIAYSFSNYLLSCSIFTLPKTL